MDINFVIKRGVTHITSLIVIVGFYTYLVLLAQNFLEINHIRATLIMVLIIALTILPFRKWLFSSIDNLFYKEEIERQKKIDVLISNLPKVNEFNQIQQDIYSLITKDQKIIDVRILILNKEWGVFETTYPENAKKVTIAESSSWVNYLAHEKLIVVLEEIPYLIESATENEKRILHDLHSELRSLKTEVVVCLKDDEKRLIGMILLGSKVNKDAYTLQNINFLKDLAREASIGLTNVLFYKQTIERLKRDIEAGKIT
jgi:GAF domain-containing protein